MKIYVDNNGKQEKVDARSVKIGQTTLEEVLARLIKVEQQLNAAVNKAQKDNEAIKNFAKKRLR